MCVNRGCQSYSILLFISQLSVAATQFLLRLRIFITLRRKTTRKISNTSLGVSNISDTCEYRLFNNLVICMETLVQISTMCLHIKCGLMFHCFTSYNTNEHCMKPFEIILIILGMFLFQFLLKGWLNGYSLGCQPVDYSSSPDAVWVSMYI